jgi:uncharacterized protein (TIGR02246 family)
MRCLRFTLVVACLIGQPLFAQQSEVTKALLAQTAAWNRADMDAYIGFYKNAPDTEAVLAGEVRGVQSIKNAYLVNFPNALTMGTLEETEVKVRELGENFAIVTGRYQLMRTKKGGGDADGIFTDIFEKTARGWKIIYSATT